jgi:hypothetical protein
MQRLATQLITRTKWARAFRHFNRQTNLPAFSRQAFSVAQASGEIYVAVFSVQRAKMILYAADGMRNHQIPRAWRLAVKSSRFGASASSQTVSLDCKSMLVRAAPGRFPPDLVVQVNGEALRSGKSFVRTDN